MPVQDILAAQEAANLRMMIAVLMELAIIANGKFNVDETQTADLAVLYTDALIKRLAKK